MKQKDYYAILNVSRDASEDEIRKVYRQLALKYHPDKNPVHKTAITKFREITKAYELLKNTVERRRYDKLNPPEPGRNLEYHLEVSLKNITDNKQGSLQEVTFEVKGKKIKLTLDKGNGTYRLRGAGEIGVYGGIPGDLLVVVNAKQQLGKTFLGNNDTEMVLIPAGEFLMGSEDKNARNDEKPVHSVYLDAFYMDKYPVTNAQYKVFVDANPEWDKDNVTYHNECYLTLWNKNSYPDERANHPVVYVSWHAAMAYAKWADKRLPTEAEWEKAARGGLIGQKYPWGNSIEPDKANYTEVGILSVLKHASNKANYSENIGDATTTTPTGSYSANGYGLYDMAGNVDEWCLDGYDADFYTDSPRKNPILDENRTQIREYVTYTDCRVLRGGSWLNPAWCARVSSRRWFEASLMSSDVGFRCAKSVTC